uniref:Thrombospondin-like N-terminal domain-containing protein n=1 Tax=Paramormyrops kingsleyae TaxID=1676925 RepID=A0A3B3RAA6_9TELE
FYKIIITNYYYDLACPPGCDHRKYFKTSVTYAVLCCRLNFPNGFPEEYSFMATFRMVKNTVNKVWNIWQVVDEDGRKQAGLRLNGDEQSLEFFLMGMDGQLQTVTFPGLSVLFNSKWHKVMVGVERDQVTLYVDCQPVNSKPIKGKDVIDTEGDTLIGRPHTLTWSKPCAVFELQWMLIHCDPKRAQRESCSELPQPEVNGAILVLFFIHLLCA